MKPLCSMFSISTFHRTAKNRPIESQRNLNHVCVFAALDESELIQTINSFCAGLSDIFSLLRLQGQSLTG